MPVSSPSTGRASAPRLTSSPAARASVTAVAGLAVGAATSFGQGFLDGPLNALVNSASAWLVLPFVLGTLVTTTRGAALAGVTGCLLQVAGYYVTAEARGFSAGGAIVVFWFVCAVVGGPLFGAAGQLWRAAPSPARRALGGALLPSAFLAEGIVNYAISLGYWDTAALWIAIGVGLAVALARRPRDVRPYAVVLPLAMLGQAAVIAITSQPL